MLRLSILLPLAALPVLAAPAGWVPATPAGGAVGALVQAPSAPTILYAGTTAAGVFRSEDGGRSWVSRAGALPARDLAIAGLAVDPADPDVVYAVPAPHTGSDALLRSGDGGRSWVVLAHAPAINQLTFDPGDRNALLAAADGLYRSRDDGASWQVLAFGGSYVASVAVDPHRSSVQLAAVRDFQPPASSAQLWRSLDGGSTWTAELAGDSLMGITPDPAHPGTEFVLGSEQTYESVDYGASWRQLQTVGPLRAFAASPAGLLYGAPFPYNVPAGVLRSSDGGRTWSPDPFGNSGDSRPLDFVTTMAVDGANPQQVLAGGSAGVWRSEDGGISWLPSSRGMLAAAPDSVAVGADGTVFCTVAGQVLRSRNRGAHWQLPAPRLSAGPSQVVTDPVHASVLYWLNGPDGLARSSDSGRSWQVLSPFDFACISVAAFTVDPRSPGTLYFSGVGTSCGGSEEADFAARSTDGGVTWVDVTPRDAQLSLIAVDPRHHSTIYGASPGIPLLRSDDRGQSWTPLGGHAPTAITALAVDPFQEGVVYAGIALQGVARSDDGGRHFAAMNQGLPSATVQTLIADPLRPGVLYAGVAGQGAFRFDAATGAWEALGGGLPLAAGSPVSYAGFLALDAPSDLLYAATPTGIFRLAAPDQD